MKTSIKYGSTHLYKKWLTLCVDHFYTWRIKEVDSSSSMERKTVMAMEAESSFL